ncbi:MAG: class I SAM-dependent methyltransferase [Euryarchaeota archaeon]|nr:class I SAM-dependent methyltransferase [Euryarchaeota archaeon]
MYDNVGTKDVIKQRWDMSSETYDCCPGHGIQSEQEKEAWNSLLKRATGVKTLDVLDVGCGTGVLSLILSEIGHNVTGIDLTDGNAWESKGESS